MLDALLAILGDEANQQTLTWIGGGLATTAAAFWTVFTYFRPPGKSGQQGGAQSTNPTAGNAARSNDIYGDRGAIVAGRDVIIGGSNGPRKKNTWMTPVAATVFVAGLLILGVSTFLRANPKVGDIVISPNYQLEEGPEYAQIGIEIANNSDHALTIQNPLNCVVAYFLDGQRGYSRDGVAIDPSEIFDAIAEGVHATEIRFDNSAWTQLYLFETSGIIHPDTSELIVFRDEFDPEAGNDDEQLDIEYEMLGCTVVYSFGGERHFEGVLAKNPLNPF